MPAPHSRALARRLTLPLLAALAGPAAAEVWVVTDSNHPVQAPAGARVIELDRPARLQADLAIGLPADPTAAATIARQRLAEGGTALQRRIAAAYQDVVDAWSLGVTTIPAVIVDRRYVVYGEPQVGAAVARIEAHRRTQP